MSARTRPLQPGEPAPEFTLPAVHREGMVSLADYRGRCPVLLAIFVGLYCPFCRRNIVQLGTTREKLSAAGVETLAVVATEIDNARLYFKYRPARVAIAADPELHTHRSFGLPRAKVTNELMRAIETVPINPSNDPAGPMPLSELGPVLDRADGFQRTEADLREAGIRTGYGDEWLKIGPVKFAADGSASAWLPRMSRGGSDERSACRSATASWCARSRRIPRPRRRASPRCCYRVTPANCTCFQPCPRPGAAAR